MTEYRQKRFGLLTPEQQELKLQKDKEYELAVQKLSGNFYQKKCTVGVTTTEEQAYRTQKSKLWNDYYNWALSAGLYEEVTTEQQLTEAEAALNEQLTRVNQLRVEAGQVELQLISKVAIKGV